MSQDDSGVHSDKEDSLVEEEAKEANERRGSKEVSKGRRGSKEEKKERRRGSNHSWSSLGRRSKDGEGAGLRRSKNEGRGSDSFIGQGQRLHINTHRHHLFHNNHMAFIRHQ